MNLTTNTFLPPSSGRKRQLLQFLPERRLVVTPNSEAPSAQTSSSPSWKAGLGICIAGACAFLNLYATQPLLPFIEHYFHTSKSGAGLTVSAAALSVAMAAPIIGALADRLGRKRLIVPAIFVLAIPTYLAAFSADLNQLIFWRFVQGLVLPAVFAIAMAYVSEEWDSSHAGAAMATFITGNVIGGFAGRCISGVVADQLGWRQSFIVLALCTLVGGALTWWLVPPSRRRKQPQNSDTSLFAAVPMHLSNPKLRVSFAIGASVLFSMVAMFTYINYVLAAAPYHFSSTLLSYTFSVYLVGAIITPLSGKLIDDFGFRRTFSLAAASSILGALLTLIPNIVSIMVGLAVFCSGTFVCQASATSSLRIFAKQYRSAAAGLYVCLYYLGGSLGGYLPGLFWGASGWVVCVALVCGVQIASALAAWHWWRDPAPISSLA